MKTSCPIKSLAAPQGGIHVYFFLHMNCPKNYGEWNRLLDKSFEFSDNFQVCWRRNMFLTDPSVAPLMSQSGPSDPAGDCWAPCYWLDSSLEDNYSDCFQLENTIRVTANATITTFRIAHQSHIHFILLENEDIESYHYCNRCTITPSSEGKIFSWWTTICIHNYEP